MHHPRGRAQRLARQRDAREILVFPCCGQPAGEVERSAHLVGELQRFAIERLDDRRAEVSGLRHDRNATATPTGEPCASSKLRFSATVANASRLETCG